MRRDEQADELASNDVLAARTRSGMTQKRLAAEAGLSRQALAAIEAGRSQPSVTLALRLARALGCRVEDLFGLASTPDVVEAEPAHSDGPAAGRVGLALVRERWVAHALRPDRLDASRRAADGLLLDAAAPGRARVRLPLPRDAARVPSRRAGCAPVLALLADRLNAERGPGRFTWLHAPSGAALALLDRGHVHLAGLHAAGASPDAANRAEVHRLLPHLDLTLVTLVGWTAGLVVPRGNPLGLRTAADLARPGVRIAAREPGAGARRLLERELAAAGVDPALLLARASVARGHLEVAHAVALGAADAGLAIGAAAAAYGLDFVPLADERFDLALPAGATDDPRTARLLDAICSGPFRREVASLGGYDVAPCGRAAAVGQA